MRRVRRSLNGRAIIVSTAIAVAAAACATPPRPPVQTRNPAAAYNNAYQNGYSAGYARAYEEARQSRRPGGRDSAQSGGEESYYRAVGQIRTTFYAAASDAGMPGDVIEGLVRIFSYTVDFQRDVQPDDIFDVVFSDREATDRRSRELEVLAASVTLSGRKQTLYRFETGGTVQYFDSDGRSATGTLMRTPVDGATITSPFGRRSGRVHEGIDMKVPSGTPVMAAGGGDVTFAGRSRGYGNFIVLEHGEGYSTAYAHLSGFASELREGKRVNQGEIIGYTGATGNATSPHLHFEVRVNGSPVDPATATGRLGRTLAGEERRAFLAERERIDRLIATLPIQMRVAEAR